MKRLACLAILVFASLGFGQDIPLTIEGNTEIVKVDQYIKLQVDRTVVTKFPTFIKAPESLGFYRWAYPANVKATDKGNVLQVDFAPQGDTKVNLKIESAVIDGGKIKYITQFADITFSVGVPGPTPVPPKPVDPVDPVIPPTDPLVATLQAAYATDPDPNKVANTASLAGLYHVAADVANDPTVKTTGDLYTRMKQASTTLKLTNAIVQVRTAIATELNKTLPVDPAVSMTDALRKTASDTFHRVETALGACK